MNEMELSKLAPNIKLKNIGRKVIKTDVEIDSEYDEKTHLKDIKKMLEDTWSSHQENVFDMKILKQFYDNKNTIEKDKQMRPDINNYVETPDVFRIVRDMNGHICGGGVVFSEKTGNFSKEMSNFNDFLSSISFNSIYLTANHYASIYGVGYYFVEPNNDEMIESPFLIGSENLDPQETYCVYNNDIIPKKIWAVNRYYYKKNNVTTTRFNVWSKKYYYVIEKSENNKYKILKYYRLASECIPVIEVQRNEMRIGDAEMALSLIKAKNLLFSNRIDDVQQVVDYVYLLYNLSLPDEDDNGNKIEKSKAIKEILKSRVIELQVNSPNIQPKVEILKNPLNQTEIQTLASYLDSVINIVVALPDRNSDSSGTSDTGVANDYKLGFRNLESYSDTVSTFIIKALTNLLMVCFKITKNSSYSKKLGELKYSIIDIKPQRNKIFSITDSANAYSTLRSAGLNDEDALKITNVSQDIAESAKKNKKEKADLVAQQMKMQQLQQQKNESKINDKNKDSQKEEK